MLQIVRHVSQLHSSEAPVERAFPREEILGYWKGRAVELDLIGIGGGHYLRRDAAFRFFEMREAAWKDGVSLQVNSSFRSHEKQQELYAMYRAGTGSLAAKPGYSNHQSGIAVDIESSGGTNAAFRWLTQNASDFDFRRTVPSEPWHWEYLPE